MEQTMRFTLCLSLALLGVCISQADDTAEFLKKENWEGISEYWKVEGNTVIGAPAAAIKSNTFLCSKAKYKDFELSFKVQLKDGVGNSGVQIRSKVDDPKGFVVAGPQCDIGAGYWGSLYGERFGGMMKEAPKDKVNEKLKPKEFNDYYIKVVGKKVTIKVNDVVAVDQEFEKMPEEGIIAFQLHSGPKMEVTFKDIKFTNLSKSK
jgi:hypothetical protein